MSAPYRAKDAQSVVDEELPMPAISVVEAAFEAVREGRLEDLRGILDGIDAKIPLTRLRGALGNTLLHRAYGFRQREVAHFLLEREPLLAACIYEGDQFHGESCLHTLIAQGETAEAKYLVSICPALVYGRADSQAKRDIARAGGTYLGELPLCFAVCYYNAEMVEFLVKEHGVLISAGDSLGNTAA